VLPLDTASKQENGNVPAADQKQGSYRTEEYVEGGAEPVSVNVYDPLEVDSEAYREICRSYFCHSFDEWLQLGIGLSDCYALVELQ
jgi:hypothetical protein